MNKLLMLLIILSGISCSSNAQKDKNSKKKTYAVTKTNAEWKKELTSAQYYILRQAGTERAFSSPLNKVYEPGIFYCAACDTPLYDSQHKFDSGTGWPSFDRAIAGNIHKDIDYKIGYARTELLCNTCGGHLGHSFTDGPRATTGMRHCINGDALIFKPKDKKNE